MEAIMIIIMEKLIQSGIDSFCEYTHLPLNVTEPIVNKLVEYYKENVDHNVNLKIQQICKENLKGDEAYVVSFIVPAVMHCLDQFILDYKNDLNQNMLLETRGTHYKQVSKKLSNEYILVFYGSKIINSLPTASYRKELEDSLPSILEECLNMLWNEACQDTTFSNLLDKKTAEDLASIKESLNTLECRSENILSRMKNGDIPTCNKYNSYLKKWNRPLFLDQDNKKMCLDNVHVLPQYTDNNNPKRQCDLENRLNDFFTITRNESCEAESKLLVVTGKPGAGKSTLISYILNNFQFGNEFGMRNVFVIPLKDMSESWLDKNPGGFLRALHVNNWTDLNNSFLVLEGLDEIVMDDYEGFINEFYEHIEETNNLNVIITCRTNRFDNNELNCDWINLESFDRGYIEEFIRKYEESSGKKIKYDLSFLDRDGSLNEFIGIPHILYMILATNIEIKDGLNFYEVYNKIFSVKDNGHSVYWRGKYDKNHELTKDEVKLIHEFSKKIAVKMWETNPQEAILKRKEYEKIIEEIIKIKGFEDYKNKKINDLLIGQYFVEGKNSLEFVHRSMYEYFVALSIKDSIQEFYDLKYINNISGIGESKISEFVRLMSSLYLESYNNFEITEFLLRMLKDCKLLNLDFWKPFIDFYSKKGFMNLDDDYNIGEKIKRENMRFANIMYLFKDNLKEIYSDGIHDLLKINSIPLDLCGVHLEEIDLAAVHLINANLSGADLSGVNLRGADLSGVNLRGADLSGTDLRDANLRDADLKDTHLNGVNLNGADLRDANLRNSDLIGANLTAADLRDADLYIANLNDAILNISNLRGAYLYNIDLNRANLIGSCLRGAHLRGAHLRGADLRNADLRDADLRGADLCDVHLGSATLKDAYLVEARLRGTCLVNTSLIRVHLRGADLMGADLRKSVLKDADLRNSILKDADLRNSNLSGTDLTSVNLNNADLREANLRGAILYKGALDKAFNCDEIIGYDEIKWIDKKTEY